MEKSIFIAPQIKRIELDNQISLVLQSEPSSGPGEDAYNKEFDHLNDEPFMVNIG